MSKSKREAEAEKLVKKYMYGGAAAGIIPVPLVDMAAITAVQVKMVHSMSEIYGVSFSETVVKSIIGALLGSVTAGAVGGAAAGAFIKFIPGIGTLLGMLSMPAFAGAVTYAVGKVFIQHFETGGTLLDFEPDKMRGYFEEEFKNGTKKTAAK